MSSPLRLLRDDDRSPENRLGYDKPDPLANTKPSPRVKLAAHFYISGAAATKREASEMAGLHPSYLTMISNRSGPVQELLEQLASDIHSEGIDTSKLLKVLSLQAVGRIGQLMASTDEKIALAAARDLADRGPETSKIQKHQVEAAFSIQGEDARQLAKAMVEAAAIGQKFASAAEGDFVELDTDKAADVSTPAQLAPVTTTVINTGG